MATVMVAEKTMTIGNVRCSQKQGEHARTKSAKRHKLQEKAMSMTELQSINHEYEKAFLIDMLNLTDKKIEELTQLEMRKRFKQKYKELFNELYGKNIQNDEV